MTTRTVTTNPAGYTVGKWDDNLTAEQIAEIYREFYEMVEVVHDSKSTPEGWYLRCHKYDHIADQNVVDLYQVRWD